MATSNKIHLDRVVWKQNCEVTTSVAIPFGQGGFTPFNFFQTNNIPTTFNGVGVDIMQKEKDWRCGVSTLDIIYMQQNRLGSIPFTNGYQFLANNVHRGNLIPNGAGGTVNLTPATGACDAQTVMATGCGSNGTSSSQGSCDEIFTRNLVLGVFIDFKTSGYTNSFIYVPQEDAANPAFISNNPFFCVQNCAGVNGYYYEFSNDMNINGINAPNPYSFMGVKLGDVNGSAPVDCLNFSSFTSTIANPRSSNNELADQIINVEKGKKYKIKVMSQGEEEILGYQFNLKFSKDIELQKVEGPKINSENYNKIKNNLLVSWNAEKPMHLNELLDVTFTANDELSSLNNLVSIDENDMKLEWINDKAELINSNIYFDIIPLDEASLNVYPNPSNGNFNVFMSNKGIKEDFNVLVVDIIGRTILSFKSNSTILSTEGISINTLSKGVYSLILKGQNTNLTKKIVVH